MTLIKRVFMVLMLVVLASMALAQMPSVVHWTGKVLPSDARAGESAQLILTATVDKGYHIYSLTQPEGGLPTAFEIKDKLVTANGTPVEPTPAMKPDAVKVIRGMHEGSVSFAVPVKIDAAAKGTFNVVVVANAQACNDKTCLPADYSAVKIAVAVAPGEARPDHLAPVTTIPEQPAGWVKPAEAPTTSGVAPPGKAIDETQDEINKAKSSGLLQYMLLAFLAGLAALVTPCVFPMIPVTVSFFAKKKDSEDGVNYKGAVAYCLGIIGTFTLVGLIVTLLFGSTGVQDLATNRWVNLAMFMLFVFLAFTLFGVVELRLPSKLVNSAHQGSRKGGILGPVLMGLTFSLTTFTCTVPFVGTILAAAAKGDLFYPAAGMIAFSTAFALPFFLLALFPQLLAKMPKSGGWLATVKAFMGFLELAAAVKFLSAAELSFGLGILTRGVFLALWAILLTIGGLYLIGWVVLGHEEMTAKIGWLRRTVGVATLVGAGYCLAGIQGTSLGVFNAFPPPDPYPGTHAAVAKADAIPWRDDYDKALAEAKKANKPVFINFTGVNCSNCRWMEGNMFTDAEVRRQFDNFVPVELYTDRTIDKERQALQAKLTKVTLNPTYVLIKPDGTVLRIHQGLEQDKAKFLKFMKSASSG